MQLGRCLVLVKEDHLASPVGARRSGHERRLVVEEPPGRHRHACMRKETSVVTDHSSGRGTLKGLYVLPRMIWKGTLLEQQVLVHNVLKSWGPREKFDAT